VAQKEKKYSLSAIAGEKKAFFVGKRERKRLLVLPGGRTRERSEKKEKGALFFRHADGLGEGRKESMSGCSSEWDKGLYFWALQEGKRLAERERLFAASSKG